MKTALLIAAGVAAAVLCGAAIYCISAFRGLSLKIHNSQTKRKHSENIPPVQ